MKPITTIALELAADEDRAVKALQWILKGLWRACGVRAVGVRLVRDGAMESK